LGGLAFGLALGVVFVVAVELRAPVIYGEQELRGVVDSRVFITVPLLSTVQERRTRRRIHLLEGVAATAMLFLISAVTFLVYRKG
jgi:hypothetical protein